MGCLERQATTGGLLKEVNHKRWAAYGGGPQAVGCLERGATRGGLLREMGHKRWAIREMGHKRWAT